ncbi:probable trehalase, partial [Tanacetum coccineum]
SRQALANTMEFLAKSAFYETVVKKAAQSLESLGLLHVAGITTSLSNSSQQWDFPNGSTPVQHMIVEGLLRYKTSKAMHEKYDVSKCGEFGGGQGETGFRWSNRVVLAFLEEFGWAEHLSPQCQ